MARFSAGLVATLCLTSQCPAQSNVLTDQRWSWAENVGWFNWRDANNSTDGVHVGPRFLGGSVWGENVGWLNVGDGSPGTESGYANTDSSDFGVNVNPATFELRGFAWGENVGWINFGPFSALPAWQHARIDFATQRLRGYAWGENIGWINLDDSSAFVAFCLADVDGSGFADTDDFDAFVMSFELGDGAADFDQSGYVDTDDFDAFVHAFEAGC